jgi:hypothetical protein
MCTRGGLMDGEVEEAQEQGRPGAGERALRCCHSKPGEKLPVTMSSGCKSSVPSAAAECRTYPQTSTRPCSQSPAQQRREQRSPPAGGPRRPGLPGPDPSSAWQTPRGWSQKGLQGDVARRGQRRSKGEGWHCMGQSDGTKPLPAPLTGLPIRLRAGNRPLGPDSTAATAIGGSGPPHPR